MPKLKKKTLETHPSTRRIVQSSALHLPHEATRTRHENLASAFGASRGRPRPFLRQSWRCWNKPRWYPRRVRKATATATPRRKPFTTITGNDVLLSYLPLPHIFERMVQSDPRMGDLSCLGWATVRAMTWKRWKHQHCEAVDNCRAASQSIISKYVKTPNKNNPGTLEQCAPRVFLCCS